MRRVTLAILLVLAAPALAQVPAAGLSIRKEKVSGAEAEFVNYPWRPDVFQTMESGGTAPESQRSWAFARLATSSYFAIDGKVIPPGHYVLALTPKTGGLPMTLELRRGDGREIFSDVTVMAPPARGDRPQVTGRIRGLPRPRTGPRRDPDPMERRHRPDRPLREPQADEGPLAGDAVRRETGVRSRAGC